MVDSSVAGTREGFVIVSKFEESSYVAGYTPTCATIVEVTIVVILDIKESVNATRVYTRTVD